MNRLTAWPKTFTSGHVYVLHVGAKHLALTNIMLTIHLQSYLALKRFPHFLML